MSGDNATTRQQVVTESRASTFLLCIRKVWYVNPQNSMWPIAANRKTRGALMNVRANVAVLIIVAFPIFAQAQEISIAKMKEEAQKVVKIISSNKAKTQIYCDLVKVSDEIEQANANSKADQLYEQMDELSAKLGPEYIELIGGLQDMDPDSEDGKEIASTLEALNKLCGK
jgi:hypothetical protein